MKNKKGFKAVLIVVTVLMLVMGVLFGYIYTHGLSGMRSNAEPADGQIRVACVGDSITYGHGVSDWANNNYPAVLQNLLGDGYCVHNYGVSGFAVQESSDRPYTCTEHYGMSLDFDADYVVFMMGSNDSKPENWKGADAYRRDLDALLDSYGDARIILCTPAAAFFTDGRTEGVTSHDIQPSVVDEIAQNVRETAAERGCILADIHTLTVQHPEWFAADGVHPDNNGAAAIAEHISAIISAQ